MAEDEEKKERFDLMALLEAERSRHMYRPGFGLFVHEDTKFPDSLWVSNCLSGLNPDGPKAPPEGAYPLIGLLYDLIYCDLRTVLLYVPFAGAKYGTSLPADKDFVESTIRFFAKMHIVCKREQRADQHDFTRPFGKKYSVVCVTEDGCHILMMKLLRKVITLKKLSELYETSAYGLCAQNFVQGSFMRRYLNPNSLDSWVKQIDFEFPKYEYVREFNTEYGMRNFIPGKIVFPERVLSSGEMQPRRVLMFCQLYQNYNASLIRQEDMEAEWDHILRLVIREVNHEHEKFSEVPVEMSCVFVVEDKAAISRVKPLLVKYLFSESEVLAHCLITTEGLQEYVVNKGEISPLRACFELRKSDDGSVVVGGCKKDYFK